MSSPINSFQELELAYYQKFWYFSCFCERILRMTEKEEVFY